MEIDPKTVAKLIILAKKNGLKNLKIGDISFEFNSDTANSVVTQSTNNAEQAQKTSPLAASLDSEEIKMPADDVMLYASTSYFDDLVEQRKAN